jgi:hypothetical protein
VTPSPAPPHPTTRRLLAAVAVAWALGAPATSRGQVPELPPPDPERRPFTLTVGPGFTTSLVFPGDWSATFTVGLGWAIDGRWTVSVAPYWEREVDHVDGTAWVHDEITLALGATYAFAPSWTLAMEVDVGLVENVVGPWERNPEVGIGVGVGYAVPLAERWALVVGPELAWKITDGDWTIGLNTGVSFDF